MKNFLLVPLGLGVVIGLLGGCGNEPSSTTPEPDGMPQFPTPQPETAPPPVILGGQTGSGAAPPRMTCEAADGGASHAVAIESSNDLRSSCAALVERAYQRLMPDLEPVGSACVAAATLDPSLATGAPICQCSFDSPDPRSDTQERISVTYAIGLERSRTLLGRPAGGCEAAGPYQWNGSASGNEECVFTSEEFGGCSLEAAATSCDSTCDTLRARQTALAARVTGSYEPLGDECHSTHDLDDCYAACIGALRADERCYRGVVARFHEVFQTLEEVDCAAPLADVLEPRETDRLSYMPFCTDHSNVSEPGVDGGESP